MRSLYSKGVGWLVMVGAMVLVTTSVGMADELRVATFEADATPPVGTPLTYQEAEEIVEPLIVRGIVLLGAGEPIVLCAVDWIGIGNEAYDAWREALAEAAGTSVQRVSVHTLHQHDAPIADFSADDLLIEQGIGGIMFDRAFVEGTIERTADAVRAALEGAQPVTHVGLGRGLVHEVASDRRLLNREGRVQLMRFSSSRNALARAAPAGRVDPEVKLVSLWQDDEPLVVLSYFATHPQSYYLTGGANPDFPGIARAMRDEAVTTHVHFTGAAGNVAAGKWNDGSTKYRQILAERLADGMARAWDATERTTIEADDVGWRVRSVALPLAEHLDAENLEQIVADEAADPVARANAARNLAWLRRCEEGHEIDLSALRLGPARILNMPGELLVEYQLEAAALYPDDFIAMAAYTDYAPGYIGTEIQYEQGGYETGPVASRVSPQVEHVLRPVLAELLDFEAFAADRRRLEEAGYQLERSVVHRGFDGEQCWVHARAAVIPADAWDNPIGRRTVILTAQKLDDSGSDVFHGLHTFRSRDAGLTWEGPFDEPTLEREELQAGRERVVSDFTPQWHAASGKLLGIGHTVEYEENTVAPVRSRATAYAVYEPENHAWGEWRELEMPDEARFQNAGAGSVQRVDLDDGTILLPIYFKEPEADQYHVTVLRCVFDGETLEYVEHGDTMTVDAGRGLAEPSLTRHDGRFYLTMRNDEAGYVTHSDDGLSYQPPKRWTFDDGRPLGNYNTQQHWVSHSNGLYLAYTRRGLDNDHVHRHRAPLLLARVAPQRLNVIESTERVIVPERGARLGNFGVVDVSAEETWVVAAEWMQPSTAETHGSDNTIHLARLKWLTPASDEE